MVDDLKAKNTLYSGISAFDLDHTLLSGNSSYLFGRYLYKHKILSFFDLAFIVRCNILFKLGLLPIKSLHHAAFERLFKGRSLQDVQSWAIAFIDEHFEKLLYLPAFEALQASVAGGHLAAILSSSPDFLIAPIAARLNITVWSATCYSVDKDHRFCDILRLIQGNDKAVLLEQLRVSHAVPLHHVHAYSDSYLDMPFLQAAGNAIGVNPDAKLRNACLRNKWKII